MEAHIQPMLDTRRAKKNNRFPVKIRVTYNRKQRYYPTGIDLTEEDFQKAMAPRVKQSHLEHRIKIDKKIAYIRELIGQMAHFSFTKLSDKLSERKKSVDDIFPVFEEIMERLRLEKRFKTYLTYRTASRSLRSFKNSIGFYDITPDFLKAYEISQIDSGNSVTTVGFHLRALRAVYNFALGKGIVTDASMYPFRRTRYIIPASRNIKKALSLDEIKQLFSFSEFHSKTEEWARDMWMLSYLANGLNMADLFRLKKEQFDEDYITLFRKKTQNSTTNALPIVVYLRPEAKQILKKWSDSDSPYLITGLNEQMTEESKIKTIDQFTKQINKYMGRLAQRCGINKKCTCYVARHSYAQSLKNAGQPIEVISEALGHSNIATTRSYLNSFRQEVIKKANECLL